MILRSLRLSTRKLIPESLRPLGLSSIYHKTIKKNIITVLKIKKLKKITSIFLEYNLSNAVLSQFSPGKLLDSTNKLKNSL